MSEFRVVEANGNPYPPHAQPCRSLDAAIRRRDFYNTVTNVSGEARMPVKPLRIERRSQVVSMWEPWNVGALAARDGRAAENARIVAALRAKGTHAADVLADQIEAEAP